MTRRSILLGTMLWVSSAVAAPGETPAQDATRPARQPNAPALNTKLQAYLTSAAMTLDPRPRAVLRRIPDRSRRMLAVAHYVQQGHLVDERWPWSEQQIGAYRETEEYRQTMLEIDRVKQTFDSLNPGYRLVSGIGGRSLTAQIAYWNRERSVARAAREFLDRCRLWIDDGSYPVMPDSGSLARFIDSLVTYETDRPPTVAVPGLSMHGRFRAFDFAILRSKRIVAGTSSASIATAWDSSGWTGRLKQAVTQASGNFIGPLEAPREPWHYEHRIWLEAAK